MVNYPSACATLGFLTILAAPAFSTMAAANGERDVVQFDVRPVGEAAAVDHSLISVQLSVSAMAPTVGKVDFDQITVKVIPRQPELRLRDYSPKTEAASPLATPVEVKISDEDTTAFGLTVAGGYGGAHGDGGLDRGRKSIRSKSFQRLPPMRAVTAAGTIHRGRGVYFKLRPHAGQVLEGEQSFTLTFQAPETWRGGVLDVTTSAQRSVKPFASREPEVRTISSEAYAVACYRAGDVQAERWAMELADAERTLRRAASQASPRIDRSSLPGMLHSFVAKFDSRGSHDITWVDRLIAHRADPYTDKQIRRLPAELRVLAIDYCDCLSEIDRLRRDDTAEHLVNTISSEANP